MRSPGDKKGYALDFVSVVRHVATEIDRAAPAALSVSELEATYNHSLTADLHRVKLHEHLGTDREANAFLIREALQALGSQIESDGNGGIRLSKPSNELQFNGRRLKLLPQPPALADPNSGSNGPFDPNSGDLYENVRARGKDDLSELRESMRMYGWLSEFPAIQDERGVTLVGHRRIRVADELGIEPVVKTLKFGKGDTADVQRLRLAWASNLGFKPLTAADRRFISAYLVREREWTQKQAAEALNVSHQTVGRDVAAMSTVDNAATPRGRARTGSQLPKEKQKQIVQLHNQGLGRKKVAEQVGVTESSVRTVVTAEEGRAEATVETLPEATEGRPETQPHLCSICGQMHTPSSPE